jgi:DNA-directed RNA polymerase subunit RPC12/RpoP
MIKCEECGSDKFVKVYTVYVIQFNLTDKYEETNKEVIKDHLDEIRCAKCGIHKEY